MHIDKRLETIANLVPQGCVLADIGTDPRIYPCGCWKSKELAGDCRRYCCRTLPGGTYYSSAVWAA